MSSYIFISPRSDLGMRYPLADPLLTSGLRPTVGNCSPDLCHLVHPGDQIFVISGSMGPKRRQYMTGGLEIAEKLAALRQFPENALRFDAGEQMGNIMVTPDCWVACAPNPRGQLGLFQMEINMLGDDGPADLLNPSVQATALPA